MNGDFEDSIAERFRSALLYRAVRDVSAAEERERRGNGGRKKGLGLDTKVFGGSRGVGHVRIPAKRISLKGASDSHVKRIPIFCTRSEVS